MHVIIFSEATELHIFSRRCFVYVKYKPKKKETRVAVAPPRESTFIQSPSFGNVRILARGAGYIVLIREPRFDSAPWKLPGGRIEKGETPLEAASRELEEETGINLPVSAFTLVMRQQRGWSMRDHGECLCEARVPPKALSHLMDTVIARTHKKERLEVTALREKSFNWQRDFLPEHLKVLQEFWK